MDHSHDAVENRRRSVLQTVNYHPRGVTEKEIYTHLNFTQKMTNRYLHQLEEKGLVYRDDGCWYPCELPRQTLDTLRLDNEEAMVLYLAARLLEQLHGFRSNIVETTLHKLANALNQKTDMGLGVYRVAEEMAQKPYPEQDTMIFRQLIQAFINRRKCRITYQPLHGRAFETTFSIYTFEPNPFGMTLFMRGHSSSPDARRDYRVDRVQSIELLQSSYMIPAEFTDASLYLQKYGNAFMIAASDDPVRIVLRFSPYVARRVKESRWHRLMKLDDESDGHVILTMDVGDTLDVKPWIRGWGADCEVLEPVSLRQEIMGEVRAMMRLYDIGGSQTPEFGSIFSGDD